MIQEYFSQIFLTLTNQIEGGGDLISWGNSVLQNGWIIWSPLLYFGFKNLNDLSSSLFIRFDWILHDSAVLFSYFKNLLKFRRRDRISWGNQFCRTAELFGSPFYFSLKKLNDLNSLSFIRFDWILHESPVLFLYCTCRNMTHPKLSWKVRQMFLHVKKFKLIN